MISTGAPTVNIPSTIPPRGIPAWFWNQLRRSGGLSLFLDYDGTLAPLTAERDRAHPWPGIREALESLMNLGARLAIISGRRAHQIPTLLGLRPADIFGCHGAERLMPDGTRSSQEIPRWVEHLLNAAHREALELLPPEMVEMKAASVEVHLRSMPQDLRPLIPQLARSWEALVHRGLSFRHFNGGFELRAPGIHKGLAVERLLQETPNAGDSTGGRHHRRGRLRDPGRTGAIHPGPPKGQTIDCPMPHKAPGGAAGLPPANSPRAGREDAERSEDVCRIDRPGW
ncbi:trehalose-phosphatase [Thermanaerovibrio acidaminovorans]|uniref:trehalose-phosphatase n=1 Tax=Thermanaerovibrio acidaminovorans TaxID=81462 RepID=UPI00249126AE|nr:trehalose-phosphatase [Thermanaerovibrio acidaminovorans]